MLPGTRANFWINGLKDTTEVFVTLSQEGCPAVGFLRKRGTGVVATILPFFSHFSCLLE